MELQAMPEIVVGEARIQTVRGINFFYLNTETTLETMGPVVDELMDGVTAARDAAGITTAGPFLMRYLIHSGIDGPFTMQIGFEVGDEVKPVADVRLERLPPFRCVSTVYSGDLEHLGPAWGTVDECIEEAGLQGTSEYREWYLYFETPESPNNIILMQRGVEA